MPRRFLTLLAVGLTGLTLVAAGCGGDGDESAAEETTTLTTTTETETTEATDTEATETEATETESSGDLGDFATSENCLEFAQIGAKLSEAFSGTGGDDLGELATYFDELVAAAPEEIKDDFQVISEAYGELAEALEGVDLTSTNPDPEALAKLTELSTKFDQAALTQASTNIGTWAQENCGVTTP